MNNFTNQWITSTLAPEAIINIKSNNNSYLDLVVNESKTIKVTVLSTDTNIIAIGKDYNELITSNQYTFREGLRKIAELLEISSISIS